MAAHKDNSLSNLPNPRRFITTHDANGKAVVYSAKELSWTNFEVSSSSTIYTTSTFPVSFTANADIEAHEKMIASGGPEFTIPNGTVFRYVDFGPGYTCPMHITQSLDFAVVVSGEIEIVLDSGESQKLKMGDVVVQRGTMHQWANKSDKDWARLVAVMQHTGDLSCPEALPQKV